VNINKEKAYALGIPTVNIARTVRLAVAGFNTGQMTDEKNESYDIIVTKKNDERNSLSAFDNLFINNLQGNPIPLTQIADLTLEASPVKINHLDKIRTVSVTAFVAKGYLSSDVITEVMDTMDKMQLPDGYYYNMGGEYESRNESFGGFGLIIMITVFLFFVVLILEFRTFKSTIIVLSVLPLGMVGAILALLITGNTLSFVAVVGLVALAGIEVKNTILLVDFTNQMRQEGKPLEEAIKLSGEVRFLPVVLTSLTAIGGFLPIAISTNPLISPLAIVLIGGLISSTLLSRIVTPVIYKLIPPKID
jgi:multidrug efflux pump subunit AcrB